MDAAVRQLVRNRAGERCEYCRLPQAAVPLISFHVEHIIPRQHDGSDDPTNLAFACPWCNRGKGPNLSGRDLETHTVVSLFNPRTQTWTEHFAYRGPIVVGLTPTGRACVRVLAMNRADALELRAWLLREGVL
ncbi:MAG TPA: HNH endonuclease [Gemmataceae bacterium]|jgi:hypothetical protein|nr:HNH endonuclease [Gemmataceae bacterium]